MAYATKKCRVCGKEYEACRSANRAAGVFRWQEVACSPECGSIYLQRIYTSRATGDTSEAADTGADNTTGINENLTDDSGEAASDIAGATEYDAGAEDSV